MKYNCCEKQVSTNRRQEQTKLTLVDSLTACDGDHKMGCVTCICHSCGCVSVCAGCLCRSRRIEKICPENAFPLTSSGLVLREQTDVKNFVSNFT